MDPQPEPTANPVEPPAAAPPSARVRGRSAPATTNGGTKSASPNARAAYPESVTRLIDELARLPGIGRRSAERLAFHLLKATEPEALGLAQAIADVKTRVRHCSVCYNLMDAAAIHSAPAPAKQSLCAICSADGRDRSLVMVVEQPKDLIALELTGLYRGLYHVLMGRISPLEGVSAGNLTVADLLRRADEPEGRANINTPIREVILALNPTLEGDGTALYLAQELEQRHLKVTRLARGLPTGSTLEFASKAVLSDAIEGRRPM
jgi:recombination protein RecR